MSERGNLDWSEPLPEEQDINQNDNSLESEDSEKIVEKKSLYKNNIKNSIYNEKRTGLDANDENTIIKTEIGRETLTQSKNYGNPIIRGEHRISAITRRKHGNSIMQVQQEYRRNTQSKDNRNNITIHGHYMLIPRAELLLYEYDKWQMQRVAYNINEVKFNKHMATYFYNYKLQQSRVVILDMQLGCIAEKDNRFSFNDDHYELAPLEMSYAAMYISRNKGCVSVHISPIFHYYLDVSGYDKYHSRAVKMKNYDMYKSHGINWFKLDQIKGQSSTITYENFLENISNFSCNFILQGERKKNMLMEKLNLKQHNIIQMKKMYQNEEICSIHGHSDYHKNYNIDRCAKYHVQYVYNKLIGIFSKSIH